MEPAHSRSLSLGEMNSITDGLVKLDFLYAIKIDMLSDKSYLYSLDLDLNIQLKNESHQKVIDSKSFVSNVSNSSISKTEKTHFSFNNIKSSKRVPLTLNLVYQTSRDFPKITQEIRYPYFFSNEEIKELSPYLQSTEIINYDSQVIQDQIKELIVGSDDYYSLIMKIAEFTKKKINYVLSESTKNDIKRASWVLINKEGACDEITVLFIALLRGAGIPARFVSGIAYTNLEEDNPWGYHSWAEVYFPGYGWVPFDVTYGEFGYLDALHVILSRPLNEVNNETSYSWKSINTDVKVEKINENFSYQILGSDNFSERMPYVKAYPEKTSVGFPSYNLINVELENRFAYYLPVTLETVAPKEAIFTDNTSKVLVLKPKEKKKISFTVRVDEDLKKEYSYSIPILFIINNEKINTTFRVDSFSEVYSKEFFKETKGKNNDKNKVLIDCKYNKFIYVNEPQMVNCSVINIDSEVINDSICLEESCYLLNIKPSEEKNFSFRYKTDSPGWQAITIKYLNKERILKILSMPQPQINLNYKINGKSNEISNKTIILTLIPNIPIEELNLTLFLNFGNKLIKLANYSQENLNKTLSLIVSLREDFIYNESNQYLLVLDYCDRIKSYSSQHKLTINLKDLNFRQKIKLFFRRLLLKLGFPK